MVYLRYKTWLCPSVAVTTSGVMIRGHRIMEHIVPQNLVQCTFDFEALSLQPVSEVVLQVIQEQKYWWSDLECRTIPKSPGIYTIVNLVNQHFYVGSATSLRQRKHNHFRDLRTGNHKNPYLQRAYDLYGSDNFLFAIVEHVEHVENLILREQHYIDTLNPEYNIARTAGSNLGVPKTPETKAKMSSSRLAHPKMLEQMENLNRRGKPHSPEARSKISVAQTGRTLPDAHKANISAAHKGKKKTPEHAANISAGKMGHPVSEQTRSKISASKTGQKHSDATKAKMSAARLGKPRDPSVGAKVSATKRAKRLAKQQQNQSPLF